MKCQDCEKFNWCDDGTVWCDEGGIWCGDTELLMANCPLPKVEESLKQDENCEMHHTYDRD
jgi:hypothetical protein